MNPNLFSIQGINVSSLAVFYVLGFGLFAGLLWQQLRSENKNIAFDITILSAVLNLILGRILFVVLNWSDFVARGWTLVPVSEGIEGIRYFTTMPWALFSFWDVEKYYQFIPLAVFFVAIIMFKKAHLSRVLPLIWRAFIPAFILITFGFMLAGNYVGVEIDFPLLVRYQSFAGDRFPIQLLDILVISLIWIFYIDTQSKIFAQFKKYRFMLFPLAWTFYRVISSSLIEAEGAKQLFDFLYITDIVWIVFALAVLVYFLSINLKLNLRNSANKNEKRSLQVEEQQLNDYSMSFGKRKSKPSIDFTPRERLEKTRNRFRRKL